VSGSGSDSNKEDKMRPTFAEWMKLVDLEVGRKCGLGYEDLPDYCYADAYEAGLSPARCAARAIRAAVA
jgi:hypothetical protein